MNVDVSADLTSLVRHAARALVALAAEAIAQRGSFSLCLSGGSTPRPLYELLASEPFASEVDWSRVQLFFGDERCVPPDHAASNYHMVQQALLARVPLPAHQVHRVRGELEPAQAAAQYGEFLRSALGVGADGAPARGFDLVLLGLGADGHTASLFPGSIDDPSQWVEARQDPTRTLWRVSLLPAVLNAGHAVWFLVSGEDKAERVLDVLAGPERPELLPAQRIRPNGGLAWRLDRAAAAKLLEGSGPEHARAFALTVHE